VKKSNSHNQNRRTFLRTMGYSGAASALGMAIPFERFLPEGFVPVALAQDEDNPVSGKEGLTILGDRPINMETPPHLLDDKITPANRLFVRNNGLPPFAEDIDPKSWTLKIDGEVREELNLTIDDLKNNFTNVTVQLQLECGGNGRRFFSPGASGNQWTFGAVGCPEWTGVRLRDVLRDAGLKNTAVYTAHYGADTHLSGDPEKLPISRGVPIEKALDGHSLIAWAINGEDMPVLNGHPLRLVVPGWPGSCSQKWLNRIWVRDREHDGPKMGGQSYRVPAYPVAPGTKVPDSDMKIITSMPVKSLITSPQTGNRTSPGEMIEVRGHAWAGDLGVNTVDISLDFGATWQRTELKDPINRYAWQHWSIEIDAPEQSGYYEIWARATDSEGKMQPATTPGWNPKGYLNNMQHRIALFVV
jgi:DMSO/TMAO reductase YedYZ molybdopterin-dependent catalytic subunit